MRKVLVAAALAAAAGVAAHAPQSGFEGEWTLNRARTVLQYPSLADLDSATVRIEHADSVIRFHRRFVMHGVPDTVSFALTLNGAEAVLTVGERSATSRLRTSGDTIVFTSRIVAPQGEAYDTVRYWLLDGGRTLQGHECFTAPRTRYDNQWVFDRR
jgi:hypothetical protein